MLASVVIVKPSSPPIRMAPDASTTTFLSGAVTARLPVHPSKEITSPMEKSPAAVAVSAKDTPPSPSSVSSPVRARGSSSPR